MAVDKERIAKAVKEILSAIGEDPNREGLLSTPHRVANMYMELFGGLEQDPSHHLEKVYKERYDEIVVVRDIPFNSMCEHHLLPFFGKVHIAYLPDGKVVGISKLARTVEAFAHRPQLQERLTTDIADVLIRKIEARGVAVLIEATHTCMTIRGVKKPGVKIVTSALRGQFRRDLGSRNEVLALLRPNDR
jgi:GTP cyclohydrolase I